MSIGYMSNHNHTEISNFRLKDCIIRIPDLIKYAIELGYNGVSITDHEALTGHIRFIEAFKELQEQSKKEGSPIKIPEDFKIGLGNEIYLIDNLEDVQEYRKGETHFWHFVLIAKDAIGYEQLCRISSESAWEHWFKQVGQERVPTIKSELEEIIGEDKGHLIASTACLGGEFAHYAYEYFENGNNPEDKLKIHQFIKWGIDVFGKDNFFLEMQPTYHTYEELDENGKHFPQVVVNKAIPILAKAYGIDYIVTTDSHYLKKEHRSIHESYLRSDENGDNEREMGDFYATTYMMSVEEIRELLSSHLTEEEIDKAFEGTMKQHNLIESYDISHSVIVPSDKKIPTDFEVEHIFSEWYNECEYLKKFAYSEDIQERYFVYLCEQGFKEKGEKYTDENIKRIDIEIKQLWLISERIGMRLASYYTLVRGLIHNIMWKVSYVGIARGSVTGFYTCYLMGITQINPMKYGLPWWRHIHESRPELPDIDTDTEAAKRPLIFNMMKEYYGKPNVLNTLTLRTEGSKSTILTCCRGLNIDNDVAQAMSDLVPFERGKSWSLKDCFYGNEDSNREPVTELVNEVAKYEGLKEVLFMIEGLISGRGIHASAAYVFENGYIKQNSRMKAPNGVDITALDMHDSDYRGGLKIDVLTIEALDKEHKTIDLLCDYGFIERKPTIKETYDSVIHPDKIVFDEPETWKLIGENKLIDAFQMDTNMGKQACAKVKPKSVLDLAVANSLMRLMAEDGQEQPIDVYVHYKEDINKWYKEMELYNLSPEEIKVLEKHLLPVYGVADTQEVMMELVMDKGISNFTVAEANLLRKAVAKKKAKLIEQAKDLFYKKGKELNHSQNILDYVWNVQISRQLGYSFSKNHTLPYSAICVQEMNLAYYYPRIFWNTACLTINAGADEGNDNNKTTQYGKVAKAIGTIMKEGQKIALPDINLARFEFTPNLETNEIVFSLKGINGIGDDIAKAIVTHRPYNSFEDFLNKMEQYKQEDKNNKFGDNVVITLIKAGAFDKLEPSLSRQELMKKFICKISKPIKSINMSHILLLDELGLLTSSQKNYELRLYKFCKYITSDKNFAFSLGKSDSTKCYYLKGDNVLNFFYEYFETDMIEGNNKDYFYTNDGQLVIKKGSLERELNKKLTEFKTKVFTQENLEHINNIRFKETWEEKCAGSISKWEMDSLCFYYHEHELSQVNKEQYLIDNFENLPETPEIVDYYYRNGEKTFPRFKLSRICGTVLDKDKNKHTVSLLTPEGVVTLKFYKGQFVFYDKQISEIQEDGTKTVVEKSWFTRGNKLLVTGMRRGDQFAPKKYKDSAFRHTVQLIKSINEQTGELELQSDRIGYTNMEQ